MKSERLELALSRIREIPFDEREESIYTDYFNELASYINLAFELNEIYKGEEFATMDIEALLDMQKELYRGFTKEDYKESIYNPGFLYRKYDCDKNISRLLSVLALEVRTLTKLLTDEKNDEICSVLELFLEVYGLFDEGEPKAASIEEAIYFYAFDYLDVSVPARLKETFTGEYKVFKDIVLGDDLSDLRYLFKFGEYVSEETLATAKYLAGLLEEDIDRMAFAYTDGFEKGFIAGGKDLKKKKYVSIIYELGFERVVKKAVENFKKMGLEPILARSPFRLCDRGLRNTGCTNSSFNRQMDYDHRFDNAVFYKKAYTDRRMAELKLAYESMKEELKLYAGPALMETFGEERFEPVNEELAYETKSKRN